MIWQRMLLCAVLLGAAGVQAQEPPRTVRAVTLEEARKSARERHPGLLAARERVKAALAQAEVPGAAWVPEVGAMAQLLGASVNNSTTTLLGTSAVDVPRVGATALGEDPSFRPYASTALGIGARQLLVDFGRTDAESAVQRLLAEVQRHQGEEAALDVDVAVVQAFYGVLSAHALLDASNEALARARSHRDLAMAAVKSGMRPAIEQPRAEADFARATLFVVRAESGLRLARVMLAAACGAREQELEASGSVPEIQELPPLASFLEHARTSDPALRAADARVEVQRARTRALEASTLPRLAATAGLTTRGGGAPTNDGDTLYGRGFLPIVPNWHAGVVLTWPLVQASATRGAAASRELERVATYEASELRLRRHAVLASAYEQAHVAERALLSVETAAQAARTNYALADQRFRVGLGTSIELSDAQALLTESEIELVLARFQAARARALLARAAAEEP